MFAISVIICSHNPQEHYLSRVIEALKTQTLPKQQWELLLVDNASEKALASRVDLSWHPNARHVREDKLGLTHARLRGIDDTTGDLLVFVDDDNVLRTDYLQVCVKIGEEYPWVGAWGGKCIPEFEVEPAAELRPWLGALVMANPTKPIWAKVGIATEALPAGAGMAIRRKQARHYRELVLHDPVRRGLDRSGKMLASGGDSDMALCGFDLGLGTGEFPALELTHLIPAERLTPKYIEGIQEAIAYSGTVVNAIHDRGIYYYGKLQPVELPSFLSKLKIVITSKSRTDRRIRLAKERGWTRAKNDLKSLGYGSGPVNG